MWTQDREQTWERKDTHGNKRREITNTKKKNTKTSAWEQTQSKPTGKGYAHGRNEHQHGNQHRDIRPLAREQTQGLEDTNTGTNTRI